MKLKKEKMCPHDLSHRRRQREQFGFHSPPNDSAHRWRPLGDSRIATRRRGAAIRWSAWLGRLVVVRFGAGPALQQLTQRLRPLAQVRTFDVPNSKTLRNPPTQPWQ